MLREVAVLQDGPGDPAPVMLWDEPYIYARLSAPGDVLVRDSVEYIVVHCRKDGDRIDTVLRKVKR